MDYGRIKMRMNVKDDRLSSLPDELIHKILSFLDIGDAIDTSVLSSRWRFIWTSMPYLNFSSEDLTTLPYFSKFVTDVLSHRNNLTDVYSVNLTFRGKATQTFVKRIMNYAFSHNIQQLNVVWFPDNQIEFPFRLFSSSSLKHLSFTMQLKRSQTCIYNRRLFSLTSTWELASLTTLDLQYVTLCVDNVGFFSKCVNLKSLTLKEIKIIGSNCLSIIQPRLSNLTLENRYFSLGTPRVVNVVAPQLNSLRIRSDYVKYVISASNLVSLFYKGFHPLHLSTEGFPLLENADICVEHPFDKDAHDIVCLLQHLHNVKFLTLNMEIVEVLSSSVNLILHQLSPFVNLKSLKIYPENRWKKTNKKVTIMSTELKSYLLDSSSEVTFTMVLREEIQAQDLIADLRMLFKKEMDNFKTNRAHLDQSKMRVSSRKRKAETKPKPTGNMVQIKSYWEDLGLQLQQRKQKVFDIVSKLQEIEELMTMIPELKRIKIQPCYLSLCTEANIVISQITDSMKILCDKNQSRSSVCLLVPLFQSCTSPKNY